MDMSRSSTKRLYLDLGVGSDIVQSKLHLHKDADHILVRKSQFFTETTNATTTTEEEEDAVIALTAVSFLENLTKLDLMDFDEGSLPIRGLTAIIKNAKRLESLRMDSVHISGSRQDFEEFTINLQKHPSLADIHLIGCLPSRETELIQGMAEALASLSSLRLVEIVETRYTPCGAWTGKALATLCKSLYLRTLRVRAVRFLRDEHLVLSANALKTNQTMKELSLLCDIGEQAVTALCEMFQQNQSLEIVSLNRIMEGRQCTELAQALAFNTTVRELHLYFRCCVVDHLRTSFLELLTEKNNYTLEKLAGGWACQNLEVFLKLNKAGRKRVLGCDAKATRSDWVDLLASRRECVQSLFYLVSQNPSICCQE